MQELSVINNGPASLTAGGIKTMQAEIRVLAKEKNAIILAHNYQVPEVQDVADFVGDSLGLSQEAAKIEQDVIVFCGVHFMAETASILAPDKTVLIPDLKAGCSLADSMTVEQLREWKLKHPEAIILNYVNTSAEVKAETDYCFTSGNSVQVVEHVFEQNGDDAELLVGPDMWLGSYIAKKTGRKFHVWDGECHVHAGLRPNDINKLREEKPQADFLIHPECGCTTNVMQYLESGDINSEHTFMLSTEGMVNHLHKSDAETMIIATETGILHRMQKEAPEKTLIPANRAAVCKYMKMITLPKLLNSLRNMEYEVKVAQEIADKARLSIERMISIS